MSKLTYEEPIYFLMQATPKGCYIAHHYVWLYSTPLCKNNARAPGGHKKYILTKLGAETESIPFFLDRLRQKVDTVGILYTLGASHTEFDSIRTKIEPIKLAVFETVLFKMPNRRTRNHNSFFLIEYINALGIYHAKHGYIWRIFE